MDHLNVVELICEKFKEKEMKKQEESEKKEERRREEGRGLGSTSSGPPGRPPDISKLIVQIA